MDKYVIDFFKRMGFYDEKYFNSLKLTVINKEYDEIKEFVGFYPGSFKLVLPSIKSVRDMLIWVHEYSHALFPDDDDEIFPNLMEATFINNYVYNKKIINELKKITQKEINNSDSIEHTLAKRIKLSAIR